MCVLVLVRCRYGARFPTRMGYLTVRLPYTAFRSEFQGQPPLDADKLTGISIRYENRCGAGACMRGPTSRVLEYSSRSRSACCNSRQVWPTRVHPSTCKHPVRLVEHVAVSSSRLLF